MSKKTVVIGFLGTTLDAGSRADRWERWRPTVSLGQQENLLVDRLELLHGDRQERLLETVKADLESVSPGIVVRPWLRPLRDPWDFVEVYAMLHDFARSYPFKPEREDYLVHITTGTHVAQICAFLLTESRHFPARLVQTSPSRTRRSMGEVQIIDLDLSKHDALRARFAEERREGTSFLKAGIATRNKRFNQLIDELETVALGSNAPILLLGPTGAGKSQLARRVHLLKETRHLVRGPFVEVNCATLRGDGAMSALFGHVRGAFTGAVDARPGLLRAADGGLLFLDEIGELGLDEQAMLLRAVEDKSFLPVGADAPVRSDFQLIAGTNRDLFAAARAGRFREDLLARIDLWTFRLPSLRERREDLEPNVDFELDRASERLQRRVTMSTEARRAFLDFAHAPSSTWDGNFRDLSAAVLRMATLAPGARVTPAIVESEARRLRVAWGHTPELEAPAPTAALAPPAGALAADLEAVHAHEADAAVLARLLGDAPLDRFDAVQLAEVVRVCRASGSLAAAGRALFAESRRAKTSRNDSDRLRKYLARFGLGFDAVVG
jgi:transcriptional regulatory protein RtcR